MINKEQYIEDIEKMISERSSDCEVYFTTITFKHMNKSFNYESYEEFFHYFRQKLDNALMCNSTQYHKRPFIFLIPEDRPALHFHGYIFIHKDTEQKFFKKCVGAVTEEKLVKLNQNKFSIHLNNNLIKPYPEARYNQSLQVEMIKNKKGNQNHIRRTLIKNEKPILYIKSIKMHPINSVNDYKRTSIYCMKRFFITNTNLEKIIIETKDKRFKEDLFFYARRLKMNRNLVNKTSLEQTIKECHIRQKSQIL